MARKLAGKGTQNISLPITLFSDCSRKQRLLEGVGGGEVAGVWWQGFEDRGERVTWHRGGGD